MLLLNYNTTVRLHKKGIHLSRRKINIYFKTSSGNFLQWLGGFMRRTIERSILKINNVLSEQLFDIKSIFADLQSKAKELQGDDLNNIIAQIDDLILLHVTFNDEIEKVIAADEKLQFPELKVTCSLLKETIEVQFNILRAIKRYNNKPSQQASVLATEASKRSAISLHTIMNGRKAA